MFCVAIIGCGAIGSTLAKAIDGGQIGEARVLWLYDLYREKAEALANSLKSKPKIARNVREICADKNVRLVIEAASQLAVEEYWEEILESGKDLMIMSVGALGDEKLLKSIMSLAERKGRKIFVPSGAIVGIDGVKAAALGGVKKVILTTRKPPRALTSAENMKRLSTLSRIKKPMIVFDGSAREAVKAFPANINVAATLALAAVGMEKTRVRIVVDPTIRKNIHEIRVIGRAGEIVTITNNVPFPESPRTSYLAALSAIRMLRNMTETLVLGS